MTAPNFPIHPQIVQYTIYLNPMQKKSPCSEGNDESRYAIFDSASKQYINLTHLTIQRFFEAKMQCNWPQNVLNYWKEKYAYSLTSSKQIYTSCPVNFVLLLIASQTRNPALHENSTVFNYRMGKIRKLAEACLDYIANSNLNDRLAKEKKTLKSFFQMPLTPLTQGKDKKNFYKKNGSFAFETQKFQTKLMDAHPRDLNVLIHQILFHTPKDQIKEIINSSDNNRPLSSPQTIVSQNNNNQKDNPVRLNLEKATEILISLRRDDYQGLKLLAEAPKISY